jgi:tetratricopeptide (TPR) repeat protein
VAHGTALDAISLDSANTVASLTATGAVHALATDVSSGTLWTLQAEAAHDGQTGLSADDARKRERRLVTEFENSDEASSWVLRAYDFDGALADVKKAEEAAERLKLTEQAARAHFLHGNLLFPLADIDGCLREHRHSLDLARQAGSAEREAAALGGLADAEYLRGRMLSAHEYARRCVEIAERHGLGRIAVANRTMLCAALWYTGEIERALREALAMIDQAAMVGHRRAEMLSQSGAFLCCHLLMEHDAARKHIEAALATARQIGASRFEALSLARRADHLRALGRMEEALADLDAALAIGRESGMAFVGPWILGILATTTEDPKVRKEALDEAEALLADNSISHNHLNFRKDAIEACLAGEDWAGVQYHAAALEDFCRDEPLPWSSFFAARGRALAAFGQGTRNADLIAELRRLKDEGERFGYRIALPAIETALRMSS